MAPTRNPLVRLLHIRDEIEGVAATITGMSFEEFDQSYSAVRTVERALQIISEAAKSLPDELIANDQSIDWVRIRALGNLLEPFPIRLNHSAGAGLAQGQGVRRRAY